MRMVADASATVAYLTEGGSATERRAMLEGAHAPTLLDIEVTHALRGLLRARALDLARAERSRQRLGQLAIRRHGGAHLLPRAWELRDVCTTYDGLYVALAESLDATLVTRDLRLARAVERLISVAVPG